MTSGRFALLIGSYEYPQEPMLHRLQGPVNDIAALDAVLSDAAIGAFSTETSINEPFATVLERVEGFLSDRDRDDVALVYFSGHGIKAVDGELYFAMTNTRINRLRATALKARDVHDLLRTSRARQQVLLLDCCYSGAFAKGMVVRGGSTAGTVDHFDGRGHAVLTASDSIQYSFEHGHATGIAGDVPRSVFTRVLVDGLSSGDADVDRDGIVTIDELYDYVHEHVRHQNPSQTPRKWAMDQQGKVVIARVAEAQRKATRLPAELIEAMADTRQFVRRSAVDQLKGLLSCGHIGLAIAARQALELLVAEDDSKSVVHAAKQALEQYPSQKSARRSSGVAPPEDSLEQKFAGTSAFIAATKARRQNTPRAKFISAETSPAPTSTPNSSAVKSTLPRLRDRNGEGVIPFGESNLGDRLAATSAQRPRETLQRLFGVSTGRLNKLQLCTVIVTYCVVEFALSKLLEIIYGGFWGRFEVIRIIAGAALAIGTALSLVHFRSAHLAALTASVFYGGITVGLYSSLDYGSVYSNWIQFAISFLWLWFLLSTIPLALRLIRLQWLAVFLATLTSSALTFCLLIAVSMFVYGMGEEYVVILTHDLLSATVSWTVALNLSDSLMKVVTTKRHLPRGTL